MEEVIALGLRLGLEIVRALKNQQVPTRDYLALLQRASDLNREPNAADVEELITKQREAVAAARDALERKKGRDGGGFS